jgi:hypothetical protein
MTGPDLRTRRRDHQERVNRARGRLAEILCIEDASDLGADRATRTVVIPACRAGAAPDFSGATLLGISPQSGINPHCPAIWLQ